PTLEQVRKLMDAWDLEAARAALQRMPKSAQTVALGKALGALDREVVRWQAALIDARADLRAGRPKEARQQAFALMNELVIRGYPLLGDFARKALALYVEADAAERARSLESLLRYAQKAVAEGDLVRARALYEKAVAVDGTHAGAHAGLGRVALLAGQHAAAVEHLGVAVRLAPDQPEYRVLLSMALRALERSAEADAYLQQALGTKSLELEARRRLSRDAQRLGQDDVVQRLEPRGPTGGR
ncbi:MAG: tetratricopeptide repeat protein, partial [Myxococcales bacterium]|nr:tetratricopeptide repeat protein [Myxococcales bacterium]